MGFRAGFLEDNVDSGDVPCATKLMVKIELCKLFEKKFF